MGGHTLEIYVHNIYGEREWVETYNYTAEFLTKLWSRSEYFTGDTTAITNVSNGAASASVVSDQTKLDGNSAAIQFSSVSEASTFYFTDSSVIDGTDMSSIRNNVDFFEYEFDMVRYDAYGTFSIYFGNTTSNTNITSISVDGGSDSTKNGVKRHFKLVIDAKNKTYTLYEDGAEKKATTNWGSATATDYTGSNPFVVGISAGKWSYSNKNVFWFDNISFAAYQKVAKGQYSVAGIVDDDEYYITPGAEKKVTVTSTQADINKVEFVVDGVSTFDETAPYEWLAPMSTDHIGNHKLEIYVHNIFEKKELVGTYNYTAELLTKLWSRSEDFDGNKTNVDDSVGITITSKTKTDPVVSVVNNQSKLDGNSAGLHVTSWSAGQVFYFTDYSLIDGTKMSEIRDKVDFYEFEFDFVKSNKYGSLIIGFGHPTSTNTTAAVFANDNSGSLKLNKKLHYKLYIDAKAKTYTLYEDGAVLKTGDWLENTKSDYAGNHPFAVKFEMNYVAGNADITHADAITNWFDNISFAAYQKGGEPGQYSATGITDGFEYYTVESDAKTVTVESTQSDINKVEFVVDGGTPTYDETAPYEWTTPTDVSHSGRHTLDIYVHNIYGERVKVGTTYNYIAKYLNELFHKFEDFEGKAVDESVGITITSQTKTDPVVSVVNNQSKLDGNSAGLHVTSWSAGQVFYFTDYSLIDGTKMSEIRDKVDFYEFEFDFVKSNKYGSFIIGFGHPTSTNTTAGIFENDNSGSLKLNKKLHYKLYIDAKAKTYTLYEDGAVLKTGDWLENTKSDYAGNHPFAVKFEMNHVAGNADITHADAITNWFDNISFGAYQKGSETGGSVDTWWEDDTLKENIQAETFEGSMKVYNGTNVAKRLMNIYAEYTPDGVLVDAYTEVFEVGAGETATKEHTFTGITVGNTVKVFTWDAVTNKPYTIPGAK